jgi:hypothetical protein
MPSFLAPNWLLAVTASRAALRAVARDGFATFDPATTRKGSAPARKRSRPGTRGEVTNLFDLHCRAWDAT